jgi:hypothetical protein
MLIKLLNVYLKSGITCSAKVFSVSLFSSVRFSGLSI